MNCFHYRRISDEITDCHVGNGSASFNGISPSFDLSLISFRWFYNLILYWCYYHISRLLDILFEVKHSSKGLFKHFSPTGKPLFFFLSFLFDFLNRCLFGLQSQRINVVDRAVRAVEVIVGAIGITGWIASSETPEIIVVIPEAEVVEADWSGTLFRTEFTHFFAGTSGSGFCTPRSVVRGADHRAGIVGQGAGRSDRVVQEVFPLATASILRIHHIADATAIASGTYQKSFQRAFGIVFLNRNTTVIEITYGITAFRFFKATASVIVDRRENFLFSCQYSSQAVFTVITVSVCDAAGSLCHRVTVGIVGIRNHFSSGSCSRYAVQLINRIGCDNSIILFLNSVAQCIIGIGRRRSVVAGWIRFLNQLIQIVITEIQFSICTIDPRFRDRCTHSSRIKRIYRSVKIRSGCVFMLNFR